MKKIIFGISVLTAIVLGSCNKDENVAKDYTYTIDEEFLNNDRGWNVFDIDTTYKTQVNTSENGLLEVVAKSKLFHDFKEGGLDLNSNFIVETTFTNVGDVESNKSFTGLTWDCIDEDNYMLFCVNQNGEDTRYVISQVDNGKDPEKGILFYSEILLASPPVYSLKLMRSDTTLSFSVNGVQVKAIGASDLMSTEVGVLVQNGASNFHYLRAGK